MAKKKTTSARKKAPVKKAPARAAKKKVSKAPSRKASTQDSFESVEDYTVDNLSESYESTYSQPSYSSQEEKEGSTFRLLALGIVILVLLGLIYYAFFSNGAGKPEESAQLESVVPDKAAADKAAAEKAAADKAAADKPAEKAPDKVAEKAKAEKAPLGVEPGGKTETAKPVASAGEYTVKPGDTLGKIATQQLGSAARWTEIKTLNNLTSNNLKVGQVLKLPAR
ncbi:MAG: LysM peptidoglycan-binding domain-containing protein [Spirochaetales bacterium]|nr:LysM peptidoglycan-binding domain-containing protein [Spirochaetales bacterium]